MHNVAVAALSFIIFVGIVLVAARLGRSALFSLSVAFILMSNVTVQMNVEIVPGVTISWAIVIYSMVYLITDLIIEFYGSRVAYGLAIANLSAQLLWWIYIALSLQAIAQPGHSQEVRAIMASLFGASTQITIAAIVAAIGPFADIFATGRLRELIARRRFFKNEIFNLLARAKLSTLLGEVINTALFFSIALANTATSWRAMLSIVVSATIAKWIISAADMPFLWLFFRVSRSPSDAIRKHAEAPG
jgi:uncharacterized integral membrane protein (TIGR00697 family)